MPIRPEDRHRYPSKAAWKQIRERILKRAENKCERCKAPNRSCVARGIGKDAGTFMLPDGATHNDTTGEYLGLSRGSEYDAGRWVAIVLTVAHLDHTPENNDAANLAALCQQCHLRHDAKQHTETRKRTASERKGQRELFR